MTQRSKFHRASGAALLLALAVAGASRAQAEQPATGMNCHDAEATAAPAATPQPAMPPPVDLSEALSIPDVLVTDQDGRQLHFYRDLVAGKVVAMNFVFTTCTTICPPMGATFAKLQKLLASRDPQQPPVALISISIDPATDTPQRLKAWRDGFSAAPGWTLVTGPKQEITRLLKSLQVFNADKTTHGPLALVGNEATGSWRRIYGLTPPAEMVKLLDELAGAEEPRIAGQLDHDRKVSP